MDWVDLLCSSCNWKYFGLHFTSNQARFDQLFWIRNNSLCFRWNCEDFHEILVLIGGFPTVLAYCAIVLIIGSIGFIASVKILIGIRDVRENIRLLNFSDDFFFQRYYKNFRLFLVLQYIALAVEIFAVVFLCILTFFDDSVEIFQYFMIALLSLWITGYFTLCIYSLKIKIKNECKNSIAHV